MLLNKLQSMGSNKPILAIEYAAITEKMIRIRTLTCDLTVALFHAKLCATSSNKYITIDNGADHGPSTGADSRVTHVLPKMPEGTCTTALFFDKQDVASSASRNMGRSTKG